MTKMTFNPPSFELNEYVWDSVWGGPAVIVGIDNPDGRYTVAEITTANKSLGRVAARAEEQLSRYVNVKLPEAEALGLMAGDGNSDAEAARTKIAGELVRRGILDVGK